MDRQGENIIFDLAKMEPGDDYTGLDCKFCDLSVLVGNEIQLHNLDIHKEYCLWKRANKEAAAIREYYK